MTITDPKTGADEPIAPPARRHRASAFIAVVAIVFFFGPAIAYLAGVRPQQIENRPLAKLPSLSQGWDALPDFGTYATDHLPGRKQAIDANNRINEDLFGQSPVGQQKPDQSGFTQVVAGKDGWLYLGDDFRTKCEPRAPAAATIARLTKLQNIITASGRRFVLLIAPDKSTIYPQHLPNEYVGKKCAPAFAAGFWAELKQANLSTNLDVHSALLAAAPKATEPLYRPRDTHWAAAGDTLVGQSLARDLDPALATSTTIAPLGPYRPIGDLTYLLGNPQADSLTNYKVVRPGVTLTAGSDVELKTNIVTHVANTSTGALLYAPKTLLLGDSFTDTAKTYWVPYFADLDLLHNKSTPSLIASTMIDHNTIVLEVAERVVATGNLVLLSDASLANIAQTLAAHPIH